MSLNIFFHRKLGYKLTKQEFSALNILTLGDKLNIDFGCKGYSSANDQFDTIDDIGEKIELYVDKV